MLKDYLREKHTSFAERLVDLDEGAKEEMLRLSGGFMGIPFTVISFDDGRKDTIIGFDKGKLDSFLSLKE